MDARDTAPTLPDNWWENDDMITAYFVPDSIGLKGESDDTPRERVTDVITADVCEMFRRNQGLIYVAPPLGSPHYGETVQRMVAMYNARPEYPTIEVLDAGQGRVRAGATYTLRLLVCVGDTLGEPIMRRRPGRVRPMLAGETAGEPHQGVEVRPFRGTTTVPTADFERAAAAIEARPLQAAAYERVSAALTKGAADQKHGLAEIDGEVKLVPQEGETLTVSSDAGEHVWDGVEEKGHAGWLMQRGGSGS
jgi:hypothetical protein